MKAKIYNWQAWIGECDPRAIKNRYKKDLLAAGFTIISLTEHHFEPFGYTALYLLAESHLAVHTFPEEKKTYVELSSCSREKYENFIKCQHIECKEQAEIPAPPCDEDKAVQKDGLTPFHETESVKEYLKTLVH